MHTIFDKYLSTKKIDADKFRDAELETYLRFALAFLQMHEDSFTAQKLYFINKLRRKYLLDKS